MGREPRAARDYFVEGRPEGQPGERPQAEVYAITSDYFKTLEIPIRAGRDFDRTDTPERPRVAIINETLAHAHVSKRVPRWTAHSDGKQVALDGDRRGGW